MKKIPLTVALSLFSFSAFAASTAPVACLKNATAKGFTQLTSVRLCAGTKNAIEPVKCAEEAKAYLPAYEAVGLCIGSTSAVETMKCYQEALVEMNGVESAAIRLCAVNAN